MNRKTLHQLLTLTVLVGLFLSCSGEKESRGKGVPAGGADLARRGLLDFSDAGKVGLGSEFEDLMKQAGGQKFLNKSYTSQEKLFEALGKAAEGADAKLASAAKTALAKLHENMVSDIEKLVNTNAPIANATLAGANKQLETFKRLKELGVDVAKGEHYMPKKVAAARKAATADPTAKAIALKKADIEELKLALTKSAKELEDIVTGMAKEALFSEKGLGNVGEEMAQAISKDMKITKTDAKARMIDFWKKNEDAIPNFVERFKAMDDALRKPPTPAPAKVGEND